MERTLGTTSPEVVWWTQSPAMFEPLGFEEIVRRKPERPVVRLTLRRG